MTTATADGHQMFAVCVDRESGKIVHDMKVFDTENPTTLPASTATLRPLR